MRWRWKREKKIGIQQGRMHASDKSGGLDKRCGIWYNSKAIIVAYQMFRWAINDWQIPNFKFLDRRVTEWTESKHLRLVTFAKVRKTAAAANARLHASLLAKPAAVLPISSVKTRLTNNTVIWFQGWRFGRQPVFRFIRRIWLIHDRLFPLRRPWTGRRGDLMSGGAETWRTFAARFVAFAAVSSVKFGE